ARKQEPSALLPGALPTTPSPSGIPWTDFRTPKEELSPTSSEAETSTARAPSLPSSPSESSDISGSSSSEADSTPYHQINPAITTLGAYRTPAASHAHQKMAATLAFNLDADDQRPLAEVRVTKLKECPMLTKGRMDDHVFQQWMIACQQFQKHSGKKDSEIMSFVVDGMLELWLIAWYHAN
ncbi:hypothetical protein C0989_003322, partial [Termitomyces sp. Mn162]